MANDARVSVVMSVYNGEKYLREAVDSILNQTFTDFEFIIIDDGSTDNTARILREYRDHRLISVHNSENRGQTRCLNQGLRIARGEYVARLDADDIALPQRLEQQLGFLALNPSVVLLGTWCECISETGTHVGFCKYPTDPNEILDSTVEMDPFAHPSVVYRRDVALQEGGYPEQFVWAQDFALWLRLLRHYQAANLPAVLVKLRLHSRQMSVDPARVMLRHWENLQLRRFAITNPLLSREARQSGQARLAAAILHYSRNLSDLGQQRRAVFHLLVFCARYPYLLLSDPKRWRGILSILLGNRGRGIARTLRAHLYSAVMG